MAAQPSYNAKRENNARPSTHVHTGSCLTDKTDEDKMKDFDSYDDDCFSVSTDDVDDWEPLDLQIFRSVTSWPTDTVPKYPTFKEEVLSHEVILERHWIRVETECAKAMQVHLLT